MKKSQVTVFVIIGIILIAVFALLIYQSKEISKKQLGSQEDVIAHPIDVQSVKSYVASCLDKSLANGLQLLGDQGGFIFSFEPGSVLTSTENPKMLEFMNPDTGRSSNVTYIMSRYEAGYPRVEASYKQVDSLIQTNPYPCRACLIDTNTPPLYCSFDIYSSYDDCRFSYTSRRSIEGSGVKSVKLQLENYALNQTLECINSTMPELSEKTGLNISVDEINSSVVIVFSSNGVSAFGQIPIEIKSSGTQSTSKIESFEAHFPVRLKQLLEFFYKLIDDETVSLSSNMENIDSTKYLIQDPPAVRKHVPNGEINNVVQPFDDIIAIIDSKSILFGQPYVFQFARQNRPPVLNVLHEIYGDGSQWTDYDFVALQESTLTVTPTAIDPDEDTLTFHYINRSNNLGDALQSSKTEQKVGNIFKSSAQAPVGSVPGGYNFTVAVSDTQFYDWQLVRLLVLFKSPQTPKCQNGQYISPVLYCDPSDLTVCTDRDPNNPTNSFAPTLEWSGCSSTTTTSSGTDVLYCSDSNLLAIPQNKCCNVGAGSNGEISDPCGALDPECAIAVCNDAVSDTCYTPSETTSCSGGTKHCDGAGNCVS